MVNSLVTKALRVPDDHIEHAYEVWLYIKNGMPRKSEYMRYLFEVYNTYCVDSDRQREDYGCSKCLSKMVWRFEQFAEIWLYYGKITNEKEATKKP